MSAIRAELSKLASLPAVWGACLAGLAVPTGFALIASSTAKPDSDTGYQVLGLGVLGAIVLGIVAIGSEYTTEGEESAGGRQITTSLSALPNRIELLVAKVVAVSIATVVLAVAATSLVFATIYLMLGADAPAWTSIASSRIIGIVLYWVLLALLGFFLTVLTRSGIVPMTILLANSSVVSVTYLLTKATPLANYLPDMAGTRMFTLDLNTSVEISPVAGGLVMGAWTAALLVVAGIVFSRRDA